MSTSWQEFFSTIVPSPTLLKRKAAIEAFCAEQLKLNRKVALITSGGTTVPLEQNTVRFLDNFSAGTRGSASAEYFLENGYAVVFLHRLNSLEPYSRHFNANPLMSLFSTEDSSHVTIQPWAQEKLVPYIKKYYSAVGERRLLLTPFVSLTDYLWLLKSSAEALQPLGKLALLYLAAAVSDFYIPNEEMPTHKIQSTSGCLSLTLQLVPKMLDPLVSLWAPQGYVISFKLETDISLLEDKAKVALEHYKHKLPRKNVFFANCQTNILKNDIEINTTKQRAETSQVENNYEKLRNLTGINHFARFGVVPTIIKSFRGCPFYRNLFHAVGYDILLLFPRHSKIGNLHHIINTYADDKKEIPKN
nr:EOG090X085T [Triops cancriformis]